MTWSSHDSPNISVREPVVLRPDIKTKDWWGICYVKGHVSFNTLLGTRRHSQKFPNYNGRDVTYFRTCDIFLYQPAMAISGRCLMHFIRFELLYYMIKKMCFQLQVYGHYMEFFISDPSSALLALCLIYQKPIMLIKDLIWKDAMWWSLYI